MGESVEGEVLALSLFEQTKERIGKFGKHRPGDVFTIINRALESRGVGFASRAQVQRVLEAVPSIFPEGWESPPGKLAYSTHGLTASQKEVYEDLQGLGPRRVSGKKIEEIIRQGVSFRENSNSVQS